MQTQLNTFEVALAKSITKVVVLVSPELTAVGVILAAPSPTTQAGDCGHV